MKPFYDLILSPLRPTPVAASDGTLWCSEWAAFLHDLIERKEREYFQNGKVIREARCSLRLSQQELSRMAGISQSLLAMVEGGQRTLSKKLIPRVWNAMSRVQQAYRDAVSLDVLIRLEESELLVTERWSKQGAGDADAVVTSLASLKPKAGE